MRGVLQRMRNDRGDHRRRRRLDRSHRRSVRRRGRGAAAGQDQTYRYLPLPHRGKGSAVRAGVGSATGDPIVFLDADLAIPVDDRQFVRAIDEGADIAIASRYVAVPS